ncbi:hypothetical protein A7981_04405 [Methylovorus sp. MM2]|uniref:hypothetical protein n=1 Tax=Methylovorus sp. MM2 TaxID=1848038 RepID=UPI0007E172C9|nr:hypothetical protein [Methylovorus sp. MM2]OAM52700.1 hypothetical protein A7981_04405 [Methylovorus sp. MM2]
MKKRVLPFRHCPVIQRQHFMDFLKMPAGPVLKSQIDGFEWTRDMVLKTYLRQLGGMCAVW